jgi:hypothetical protein
MTTAAELRELAEAMETIARARRDLDAMMALPPEAFVPSRSTVAETSERVRLFEAVMGVRLHTTAVACRR